MYKYNLLILYIIWNNILLKHQKTGAKLDVIIEVLTEGTNQQLRNT